MILEEKFTSQVKEWILSDIVAVEPISGGRNSKTYKIYTANNRAYTLKCYFQHISDPRDRMGTEFNSLSFLWAHGFRNIPQPIASDKVNSCALYQYVDGSKLLPENLSENDVVAASDFLEQLRQLGLKTRSEEFSAASEACFSVRDLLANLDLRRQRFLTTLGLTPNLSLLQDFLQQEYDPICEKLREQAYSRNWYDKELSIDHRILSPSDFGFHNTIRRIDGTLIFLDFEYFGWDDPVKTLCDFLLHPAMQLEQNMKIKFFTCFSQHFRRDDILFAERSSLCYRLYALKWCLIILNEFLPDHWDRRSFAGQCDGMKSQIQLEQLAKAKKMMEYALERRNWLDSMLGVSK